MEQYNAHTHTLTFYASTVLVKLFNPLMKKKKVAVPTLTQDLYSQAIHLPPKQQPGY
jgi:hypothetical protein